MTACAECQRTEWSKITGRCNPLNHSPGGTIRDAPLPFRSGKTRRDHRSGAWARRLANRAKRAQESAR